LYPVPVRLVGCAIAPNTLAVLDRLIDWCAGEALGEGRACLSELLVCPRSDLEAVANGVLQRSPLIGTDPSTIVTASSAVAIPVPFADRIECVIVLAVDELRALAGGPRDLDMLALTVLEEFFHVRHYAGTWSRRRFVNYPPDPTDPCLRLLLNLAYHLLDEYVVGRWKAEAVSGELCFGANMPQTLNDGCVQLAGAISSAAAQTLSIDDAWARTHAILKASIFGPLVRDAGRRAPYPGTESPSGDPQLSLTYRLYIWQYWRHMLTSFEAAFARPESTEASDREVAALLRRFLAQVGITLSRTTQGTCWITFADRWATQLINWHTSGGQLQASPNTDLNDP
jgi:hypothetical protein